MNRRTFLKTLGTTATTLPILGLPTATRSASTASGTPAPRRRSAPDDRPNIIVIMADDMGFSDIGCYGGEIRTPNIDRLAANGLRFRQFYNTGRCCPTRAALLTGLYPHQAGIGDMTRDDHLPAYRGRLNDACVTIGEVLRTAGYRTLMTGKWHVGSKRPHWPVDRGFDRSYCVPQGGGIYFHTRPDRQVILDDKPIDPPDNWYVTDAFTDWAIRFIDEARDRRQPFFLYLAHIAPHWPLKAWPEDIARYEGLYMKGWDRLRQDRYQRQVRMGLATPNWRLPPRDDQVTSWDQVPDDKKRDMAHRMAVYAAQVDRIDQNVGKLVRYLKEHELFDNTLILFLSDNGGSHEGGPWGFTRSKAPIGTPDSFASYGRSWANASNTPFRMFKHWVHEGGIATPLIAHWPGKIANPGGFTDAVGHVIDIMATCCDLAGAEYPKTCNGRPITPLEGRSLVPIFTGRSQQGHEQLFWEHEGNRAVRQGPWKLVSKHSDQTWELYDLAHDRCELNDLAARHPDRLARLKAAYQAWADRCGVVPKRQLDRHRRQSGKT